MKKNSNLAVVQEHVRDAVLDGVLAATVRAHQRTLHNVQVKDDVVERLQERLVRKLGLGRRLARNRLTTLLQSL